MRYTQCKNGHHYDESLTSCPECGTGGTVLLERSDTQKKSKIDWKIIVLGLLIVIMMLLVAFKYRAMNNPVKNEINTTATATPPPIAPEVNNTKTTVSFSMATAETNVTTPPTTTTTSTVETNTTRQDTNTTATTQAEINTTVATTTDTNITKVDTNTSVTDTNATSADNTDNTKTGILTDIKKKFGTPSNTKDTSTYNFSGDK